jgi:hypothetical protein
MAHGEVRLPRFETWRESFDGSVGLWDYASREGGLTLALAFASLFFPRRIEVEDCVLLEARYEPVAFHQWREELGEDKDAIERVINHVHLWDLFDPAKEGVADAGLDSLLAVMSTTWEAAYAEQFPSRVGKVIVEQDGESYGPTITLCTERDLSVRP